MSIRSLKLYAAPAACAFVFGGGASPVGAQGQQYCERTNYSAQQIADAVNASPLREDLKSTSCSLGGLGRFESGGNKGVYNGSCCTGIFQLNKRNVRDYANTTPEEFGCSSLQEQVDAWAHLTNAGYETPAVRQLAAMDTFDGQKVDAGFISACIQLGPGNCQQMLNSGKCSGFSDSNGTTICDMARNARSLADASCKEGEAACVQNGPGDFPAIPGMAANPPTRESASIIVGPGQV